MTDRRRTDDPILAPLVERLAEAADTLRRLPARGVAPTPLRAAWPPFVRDAADAYGYTDAQARPSPPSAAAIDRLDETIGWIASLDPPAGMIIWLRANRVGYRAICKRLGCSRETARKRWREALVELAARIAGAKPKRDPLRNLGISA